MNKKVNWEYHIAGVLIAINIIIGSMTLFPNDRNPRICNPNQTYLIHTIENSVISMFK